MKVKDFLSKNKKIIIPVVIVVIIVILALLFFLFNSSKESKILKEDTFTAYIKINPLVKLTFKGTYYECTDKNGKKSICGEYENEITKVDLLNDDAKELYNNVSLKGKSLNDAVVILAKTAYENNISISEFSITTNWNYRLDEIKAAIEKDLKKNVNVEVSIDFNYKKNIKEKDMLDDENIKTYTITFDSDGGSEVKEQKVKENDKVQRPDDPTKDGYTFVEWQLDNVSYDFDSEVVKNITLKAKWERVTFDDNNNSNNKESSETTKEQDNETLKKQLALKGLSWDFNSLDEANNLMYRWMQNGYSGEVYTNSYGKSDTAYSVVITLNTAGCGGNSYITVDWQNYSQPIDFVYYLHSKGYNCSGQNGYYEGKHFTIDSNNVLTFD